MLKEELFVTASLARLEFDDAEAEKLNQSVTQMLEHFSLMDKIDLETIAPFTHVCGQENRTREDVPAEVSIADKLIENAPEKDGRFIIVPNVL